MINKGKITLIVSLLMVALGVFGALALVRQNQELRRGATVDKTTIKLSTTEVAGTIDSNVTVGIMIETPRKVSTANVKLCYGDALTTDEASVTSVGPLDRKNYIKFEGNCLIISKRVEPSTTVEQLPTGSFQFANVIFKIKKDGNLTIDKANSLIGGEPVNGSDDVNVPIDEVTGATVKLTSGNVETSTMSFESNDLTNKKKNENLSVKLFLDTTKDFDSAEVKFCYGDKLLLESNKITIGGDFTDIARKTISNNCIEYSVLATGKVLKGKVLLGTFDFKAINTGSGKLEFDSDIKNYSGSAGLLKVSSSPSVDYTIGEPSTSSCTPQCSGKCGGSDGCGGTCGNICNSIQTCVNNVCVAKSNDDASLKYKVSFVGVKPSGNDPSCTSDWSLNFTVVDSAGTTKTYTSVPTKTTATNNVIIDDRSLTVSVFEGTVGLSGLTNKSNLSVFIKGPRHLQMKYGKDDQVKVYDKAGGEISVVDQSSVHDFSKYPILAGDVNSDGTIDGRDYTLLKTELDSNNLGEQVTDSSLDLDGNCMINTGDSTILKMSLVEKQGQLY